MNVVSCKTLVLPNCFLFCFVCNHAFHWKKKQWIHYVCQEIPLLCWWQPSSILVLKSLVFWYWKVQPSLWEYIWPGGRAFLAESLFPLCSYVSWLTRRYYFASQVLSFWAKEESCQKLYINNMMAVLWKLLVYMLCKCKVIHSCVKAGQTAAQYCRLREFM